MKKNILLKKSCIFSNINGRIKAMISLLFLVLINANILQAQSPNLAWARGVGGTSFDEGTSVVADTAGNVYTTGSFSGTVDFDPNAGVLNLISAGGSDIFISKLNASGNLTWAKRLGGTSNDSGIGIAIDAEGNVYSNGSFRGTADFDPNAGVSNLASSGGQDIFVSKLDASGNLVWAKRMGGGSSTSDFAQSQSIVIDAAGNLYYRLF